MNNYEKPIVVETEELAEGIYAASGGNGENCYYVETNIHQKPETGRGDYRIQVTARHAAANGHHSTAQVLTLYFNQPVTYKSSNGSLSSGDGTSSINIAYGYHNNGNDNIGLGDVVVESEVGLAVTGAKLDCNYTCDQHDALPN